MERDMFSLYFGNETQCLLFGFLRKLKSVKILDCCDIARDADNQVIGKIFFLEGPKHVLHFCCRLAEKQIKDGVPAELKTKGSKIIFEEV